MTGEAVDGAYSRARHDPAFLDAVRREYAGRYDLLDALWWLEHPADSTPDGTPPPVHGLRDLQRRVFAADGGSLGDPAAALALREFQSEVSAERAAIETAVAAVEAEARAPGLDSLFPMERPVEGAVATSAGAMSGRVSKRTVNLLVLVGIVAAAAGVVAGTQLGSGHVDAAPSASPTPAVTAEETCGQLADVVTFLANAAASRMEKRSTELEWQGATALAARLLDRVDTAKGTPLAQRVAELKVVISTVKPIDATPEGWFQTPSTASRALYATWTACDAASVPFGAELWQVG